MAKTGLIALLAAGILVGFAYNSSTAAPTSVNSMADTHNPGAILYTTDYAGVVGSYYNPVSKKTFAVFDSDESGVNAIDTNLQNNYFGNGITTIQDIAHTWTGGNATAPVVYLKWVQQAPAFSGQTLDVTSDISEAATDPVTMSYLIAGIIANEGNFSITPSQIESYIS